MILGISGGIAAYKVCEVASTLAKAGVKLRPILTQAAQEFITPLTLATLCRHRAYTDQEFWQPSQGRPLHIELGEWADLLVIAPLTAQTLAKLAGGFADNLLTNTVLASRCPILLAPAMNTDMWEQGAVQRNWQQVLTDSRYHGLVPGSGILACDRVGAGRMAEPRVLMAAIESLLYTQGRRDLQGKRVLISAGGTREHFDPVRFIGNPATGKMGVALAQAAHHRGAIVTVVHGLMSPELMADLQGMRAVSVINAAEMQTALFDYFEKSEIIIMSAAVADVKPASCQVEKVPKKELPNVLPLVPVPDIIAQLGCRKLAHQCLVGFAAQTGNIEAPAREKLERKQLDVIVANPIDQVGAGFGSDSNQAIFLGKDGRRQEIPHCSKLKLAHHLFDFLTDLS